jgi:hypothetical protein
VMRASLTGAQKLGRAKGGTKMKWITRSRRENTRRERHHRCHCFRGALLRNQDANAAKLWKDKECEGDKAKEWMKDEGKPFPSPSSPPPNGWNSEKQIHHILQYVNYQLGLHFLLCTLSMRMKWWKESGKLIKFQLNENIEWHCIAIQIDLEFDWNYIELNFNLIWREIIIKDANWCRSYWKICLSLANIVNSKTKLNFDGSHPRCMQLW